MNNDEVAGAELKYYCTYCVTYLNWLRVGKLANIWTQTGTSCSIMSSCHIKEELQSDV